jgi:hypothetical protein
VSSVPCRSVTGSAYRRAGRQCSACSALCLRWTPRARRSRSLSRAWRSPAPTTRRRCRCRACGAASRWRRCTGSSRCAERLPPRGCGYCRLASVSLFLGAVAVPAAAGPLSRSSTPAVCSFRRPLSPSLAQQAAGQGNTGRPGSASLPRLPVPHLLPGPCSPFPGGPQRQPDCHQPAMERRGPAGQRGRGRACSGGSSWRRPGGGGGGVSVAHACRESHAGRGRGPTALHLCGAAGEQGQGQDPGTGPGTGTDSLLAAFPHGFPRGLRLLSAAHPAFLPGSQAPSRGSRSGGGWPPAQPAGLAPRAAPIPPTGPPPTRCPPDPLSPNTPRPHPCRPAGSRARPAARGA